VFKPVRQRLVRRHPVTERKSLFLSAHAGEIEGMSIPEGRMLLLDLTEFATREQFVYSHNLAGQRLRDVGQPFDNASRTAVRSERGTRYQADAAGGRRPDHLPGWCLSFRAPARPVQLGGCRHERLPPWNR